MIGVNDRVSSRPRVEHGAPLPSLNEAHELARWCPHGVKRILIHMPKDGRLDSVPPVLSAWMAEQGMTRQPTSGPNAGHVDLSDLGKRTWRAIHVRLEGKD